MANVFHGGFRPVRTKSGGEVPQPQRFEIASGYNTDLFHGQLVTFVTAGTVEAVTAGYSALILGAIAKIEMINSLGERRQVKYWPANSTFSPTALGSAQAAYVWVWVGTDIIYEACVASHANTNTEAKVRAAIQSNMDIVVGSGSTYYGQAASTLDGNPIAGSAQMRVEDVVRAPDNDLTAANWRAYCSINEGMASPLSTAGI